MESKRRRTVIQKCRAAPAVIHVLQNVAIYIISIPDPGSFLGFDETNVDLLEKRLLAVANSENVKESKISEHGNKYVIEGLLETPSGKIVKFRTIWVIDEGQDRPRFVTAYPV